jgi:flagellar basal-body rod modification protein FlgD
MEQLNTSFGDMLKLQEITQGTSLIGKNISYTNASGAESSGKVASVGIANGSLALQVGSDSVTLDQVSGVAS